MSWNYRVGTHVFSYKKVFTSNPKLAEMKDERLFSMIEVYYDEDGKPNGYADKINPTDNWEDLQDLIGTLDLLKLAVDKPIIDIDNFPNEWNPLAKVSIYNEEGYVDNLEVWDYVVTKKGKVLQITHDDMSNLTYQEIERHATLEEIEKFKK